MIETKVDRPVKNSLNSLLELIEIPFDRGKDGTDFNSTMHDQIILSLTSESFMAATRVHLEIRSAALHLKLFDSFR